MVVRDNPVASATSEIPPRPRLWASAAAQRRRIRSSMIGDRAWNFAWIFATVVCVFIRTTYGQGNHCPVHFASAPMLIIATYRNRSKSSRPVTPDVNCTQALVVAGLQGEGLNMNPHGQKGGNP